MTFHKLRRKAQHLLRSLTQDDEAQKRALFGALRLFGAMLVLTLVARTAAGAALPTVTVTSATEGVLVQTLETSATISSVDGTPFATPEGLLVEAVYAAQGESIAQGAPLARFMPDSVTQALSQAKAKRTQMAQQAAQLRKGESADPYGVGEAQSILNSANTAYDDTRRKGEAAVAQAVAKRNAAKEALEAFLAKPPASSSSSDSASNSSSGSGAASTLSASPASAASNAAGSSDAQSNAQASQADARAKQEQALREALQQAEAEIGAAQTNADSANEAARQNVLSAERARNSALHNYEKAAETAADQTAQSRADAGVLAVSLAQQDTLIATLTSLLQNDCVLTAPGAGTLTQVALIPGTPSPVVGGAIADTSGGCTLTFSLNEEQAKTAAVGMAVSVTQKSITSRLTVATLSAPDAEGTVTASVRLPAESGAWQSGAARVTAELSRERHSFTLPPTAVQQDLAGSFVYSVETSATVLGDQDVLVRVPVTVAARTADRVAVSGGLSAQMRLVDTSTKPLQSGARVRVALS